MTPQEIVEEFNLRKSKYGEGQNVAERWLTDQLVHLIHETVVAGKSGKQVAAKARKWLSEVRDTGGYDWLTPDKVHELVMASTKLWTRELELETGGF